MDKSVEPSFEPEGLAKAHFAYISEHDAEKATPVAEVPYNSTTRFNPKFARASPKLSLHKVIVSPPNHFQRRTSNLQEPV